MAVETVQKDILDKLNAGLTMTATNLDVRDLTSASDSVEVKQATAANLKAEVVNPAGTGLSSLGYGSTDAGTTWVPITVDAAGHLQVDVLPKTSYLAIAGCEFHTDTPATDNVYVDFDNGILIITTGTSVSAGCSVSLPHEAVVTAAKVEGTGTWTWYLYRDTHARTGFPEQLATAANGTEDTTIANATIDNATYSYWFEIFALDTDEDVRSAKITYTK